MFSGAPTCRCLAGFTGPNCNHAHARTTVRMEETAQLIVVISPPAAACRLHWETSANIVSTTEKMSNCLSLSISVIPLDKCFILDPHIG